MMKKINITAFILLLLVCFTLLLPTTACAESLKMDNNGVPIQLSRYFTTISDTIPAQASTVYDSLAVPANAAEVVIVGRHNALYVKASSSTTIVATEWIYVPKDVPLKLPVMDSAYICYKAVTGAASLQIAWLRM
jgi:hypothetical protein